MTDLRSRLRGATGIRTRLMAAVALITLGALTATFIAVYRGTGSNLRAQIDSDLSEDAGTLLEHLPSGAGPAVARGAQRYINAQPTFGPASELLVANLNGAAPATNEPELLGLHPEAGERATERRAETDESRLIRSAPDGFSTVQLQDVGEVRLLTRPLVFDGRSLGSVTVGQPLEAVHTAQSEVSRTFLLAGALGLIAALVAAAIISGWITGPLRRMARVAGALDAGDLTTRMVPAGSAETRQLAESFNHMLDRLEEAFVRQRTFVSDASHELRTPLTAIRGQIEVLARAQDASQAEIAATARVVTREVDRMERLVDDLLLLAQADEGLAHEARPTEISHLLSDAVAGLAPADRRLEVERPPPGTIVADPDRIAQVVRNLVGNAIDHTSAGGVIRVTAAARNGRLRVSVDDDGPGIPERERGRIFARFYRAEGSRNRSNGGAGLGLAIAQAIVAAHGGRIWAERAPLGGARIVFELPGFRAPRGSGLSGSFLVFR